MRALALLSVFLALPALAGGMPQDEKVCPECPAPPRLTCDQLWDRIETRCPAGKRGECDAAACPECKQKPCDTKAVPPPDDYVTTTPTAKVPPVAAVGGRWIAGGGAIFRDRWGAYGNVGYMWPSGWMLTGGPIWLPSDTSSCGVTIGCETGTCAAPDPSPWGAMVGVGKVFGK